MGDAAGAPFFCGPPVRLDPGCMCHGTFGVWALVPVQTLAAAAAKPAAASAAAEQAASDAPSALLLAPVEVARAAAASVLNPLGACTITTTKESRKMKTEMVPRTRGAEAVDVHALRTRGVNR